MIKHIQIKIGSEKQIYEMQMSTKLFGLLHMEIITNENTNMNINKNILNANERKISWTFFWITHHQTLKVKNTRVQNWKLILPFNLLNIGKFLHFST